MLGMVDVEFIKKKHFQEGWSIRRLAKVLAINPNFQQEKRKKSMQAKLSAFFKTAQSDYAPLRGSASHPEVPKLSVEEACFQSAWKSA